MSEGDDLPYRRLWAAVFHRGLLDAAAAFKRQSFHKKPEADFDWLISDDKFPGSFVWLCDLFDLDPNMARAVWRMKVRTLAEQAAKL